MEEVEKSKMIKTKRALTVENKKVMSALAAVTIREIVKLSNELDIKKEDIVSLLKENSQFVLVYYK